LHAAWSVKHKPKSLADVIGNAEAIGTLIEWTKSWEKGTPKKRATFLYGPPGVGKTVTVEALAHDYGMEFVEKNASDYRTEEAINRFAGLASQYGSLFGGKRIILLDELDGLTGTSDRGGVKAITDVVKAAQCPMVLISNSAYDPRFSTLRTYCLLIEFKKLPAGEVAKRLKLISEDEGIQADEAALKFIAQRSGGDVRSAVNDLQALGQSKKTLTYEDVSWLGYRDRQENIFNVLKMLFYGKTCAGAKQAANIADVDADMLFEWIYENVPAQLTDPYDLADAMDALSIADVYRGRIRATQNWGLLRYVMDYMTAGVALSRKNTRTSGWVPFKFPQRIQMLSRSRAERAMKLSIGAKVKRKNHISAKRASKEVIPYLKIMFNNNAEMAAGLAKWLDLSQEMVEYLVDNEKKAEDIVKLMG
jgi:replication factor C large subunit